MELDPSPEDLRETDVARVLEEEPLGKGGSVALGGAHLDGISREC